jgi:arginase family enzyme
VKTTAVFFPFDLFGSGGCGAGATALAEALREILADNRRERVATRARAYTGKVRIQEVAFATLADYQDWQPQARRIIRRALDRGDFLLWVTGNHLGVLPLYEELGKLDGENLVVQLDAHLDIQHFSEISAEPSHANFLLHQDGPAPVIINVGHRDLLLPTDHIKRYYRQVSAAEEFALDPGPILKSIAGIAGSARRIFFDIDCDVFDPAFFPAVAHPSPMGLLPADVLRIIESGWSPQVGGVAISEFDSGRDRDDRSLSLLVWLIERLLLKRHE